MKFIASILLALLTFTSIQAAHIIGGTVEYTVNSVDGDMVDVDVTFYVYRDATTGGAAFDQIVDIGLFGNDGSSGPLSDFIDSENGTVENIQAIDFSDVLDCVPASLSFEAAMYRINFVFDIEEYHYFTFVYQRCCRGPLTNLLSGEETGIALSIDITRAGITRVGTVNGFSNEFPAATIPADNISFDLFIDDGFTKKYKITDALVAGGTDGVMSGGDVFACTGITPNVMNCPPPYDIPMYAPNTGAYGLLDQVTMDSISGELTCALTTQGSFLIALEAKSFEDNELLSTTRQQFVQVVSMCLPSSLEEEGGDLSTDLYPVPVSDVMYIKRALTDVKVFDTTGKGLLSKSFFNSETGIDVSDLLPGVYFMEGYDDSGIKITKRFIK